MTNESHPTSDTFPGGSPVDRFPPGLIHNRPFNRIAGDTDLVCDTYELFEGKPLIDRVVGKVIEPPREIDDIPDLIAREPLFLPLLTHDEQSMGTGRSVPGQVKTKIVRISQIDRTIPVTQMRRMPLVP